MAKQRKITRSRAEALVEAIFADERVYTQEDRKGSPRTKRVMIVVEGDPNGRHLADVLGVGLNWQDAILNAALEWAKLNELDPIEFMQTALRRAQETR